MNNVSVEILEDESHPEGGFAVILLRGVESLPDRATFRLKPVEARGNSEAPGEAWPSGELTPLAVRGSVAGIELLIGPDIVEAPALLPGTLGVVEIRAAGVRGEFLWPSIRPTARPRRRNLSVVKPSAGASAKTKTRRVDGAAMASSATSSQAVAAVGGARMPPLASMPDSAPRAEAEGPKAPGVPVTALDHAAPATASIAEAVGGNVVQFNAAREALSGGAAEEADHSKSKSKSGRDNVETLSPRNPGNWQQRTIRATATVAAAAVLVSGALLLVGSRAGVSEGDLRAAREAGPTTTQINARPQEVAIQAAPGAERPSTGQSAGQPAAQPEVSPAPGPQPVVPSPQEVAPTPEPARQSQEVTLRMRGGGFQISGELKGFDGSKYIIETRAAGLLTMDASRFECDGEACARPVAAILPLSERPSPSKPDVFRIEGAPALTAEFVPQLIKDYAVSIGASAREIPQEPGREAGQALRYRISDGRGVELATIEVASSGSISGLTALDRGTAVIAVADRPLGLETEARPARGQRGRPTAAAQPTSNPAELFVGIDGIAAVAAPSSAPGSISLDLLAKVVAGQITDWFELGGQPGPIELYLPPDGGGTLDTFVRQVMQPRGLQVGRAVRRMASDGEAAEAAMRSPRGLAVVSFAGQRGAKAISLETSCGLVIRPTAFAVKAGEYPLVRRLSMHLPAQLSQPSARGIVRIAQSGEVGNALAAARIIDQSIAALPIEEQSERLAWAANAPAAAFDAVELRQMLNDLQGATRLSVTFRFVPGTNELDQRSRRDVARLALALKEPELAGRRIILAGFTDASGKLQPNMAAAMRRAGQVKSALAAAGGAGFDQRLVTAKGYGPLAPVACAATPDGVRLNRRVEVWIGGKDVRAAVR